MDEHVYRVIEIVGSSPSSIEDAINNAIARANATIRNLRWFEVLRSSGQIEAGKAQWRCAILAAGTDGA
jgi:flavin-binding protein dodecin